MMDCKSLFLKAILGEDTAEALARAIARCPELEGVVLPRAALSWVGLAASGYNGSIPGIEGTKLVLNKSEKGLSGAISSNGQSFAFNEESIYLVTSAIVCALGLDKPSDLPPSSKIQDLGKSLDLMVKARIAVAQLNKALPMGHEKPGGQQAPKAPTPPTAPTAVAPPTPAQPKKAGVGPKIGQGAPKSMVPAKKKGIKILRRHLDTICGVCNARQFNGEKFIGCVCFPDLQKATKVVKMGGDVYELQFGAGWDLTTLRAFIQGLE